MEFLTALKQMINPPKVNYRSLVNNGALIIDVRSKEEYRQGHAKGSINIPLHELNGRVKDLGNKEVILVCRSGMRASQARHFLKGQGINAHNAGAWQNVKNLKN